jgi:hypothetical protein
MGGSPGASGDPSTAGGGDGGLLSQLGAGINNNTGLARIAQANPAIGQMLGQMGYTGPYGPQQPVGTATPLTPQQKSQQSGWDDIAKYGQGMMAGGGLGGAAPAAMAMPKPLQMPAPYAPQVGPMQPIQNPYGGGVGGNMSPAPTWGNRMAAGGANPQFFPYFR